jgi:hypothetical protein
MPKKKEPHFFGTDLYGPNYIRDTTKYLSLFAEARNEKRVGEGSIWYLYSQQAASEIKQFCSTAQIIIMLRNPVDMMYSLHSQRLYNNTEDIENFQLALLAERDRKHGRRLPDYPYPIHGLFYRECAQYTKQIQRYFDTFNRDNIHIIIFDDFTTNTAQVFSETLRFLNVTPTFRPDFPIINANKRLRSKKLRGFLRRPPRLAAQLSRTLLPTTLRQRILGALVSLNTTYVPREPMEPRLRCCLQQEFKAEIEQLSQLLDRDLSHWAMP